MAQTNPRNLWPDDLVGKPNETEIVAILRQQAEMLSQLTNNVLEGEVVSEAFDGEIEPPPPETPLSLVIKGGISGSRDVQNLPDNITNIFYIKVPSIEYRYKLFYIHHAIVPEYPARIVNPSEFSIFSQTISVSMLSISSLPGSIVRDEEQLCDKLREIFNADRTKKVIRSLMAQSVS